MQKPHHSSTASRDAALSVIDRLPAEMARDRIFSAAQSAEFVGFSLPHFRRLYRTGKAPNPIQIGERKLGWKAGALIDWVSTLPNREVA